MSLNDQIRELIWHEWRLRQPDPRSLGCRAPMCRCVDPCDALAMPEITREDFDDLYQAAKETLLEDPAYAFWAESLKETTCQTD